MPRWVRIERLDPMTARPLALYQAARQTGDLGAANSASYFTPSAATILYLAYCSPILRAGGEAGEVGERGGAAVRGGRRIATGPFGRFPVTRVPAPAATY